MGDETTTTSRLRTISDQTAEDIIAILRKVYGGGYVNNTTTWEQRKELRGKSYRALKALGLEK